MSEPEEVILDGAHAASERKEARQFLRGKVGNREEVAVRHVVYWYVLLEVPAPQRVTAGGGEN